MIIVFCENWDCGIAYLMRLGKSEIVLGSDSNFLPTHVVCLHMHPRADPTMNEKSE